MLTRAGELLADFEPSSVTAVLHAACSSPTSRQALASCAALLISSWAAPPSGSRIAVPDDLAGLIGAFRADCPDLATVEDFLPLDPRLRVRFRASSDDGVWDFPVHPGALESPLQALQNTVNYAEAVDPVLLPRLGFGVADMLRLTARMLESELAVLSPVWDAAEVTGESPPVVTGAEVDAARSYLEQWRSGDLLREWLTGPAADRDGSRFLRAAEMLTISYEDLSFDAGPGRAHVRPALVVRGPAGLLPVPSALIVESLTAAVTAALRFVASYRDDPAAEPEQRDGMSGAPARVTAADAAAAVQRWRSRVVADLEWACRATPATVLFGNLDGDGQELLLISPGHRHVVAVDLVTGLWPDDLADGIRAARQRLAKFGPGSLFRVSPQRELPDRSRPAPSGVPPAGTTDPGLGWGTGTADALPFAESLVTGESAALADGTAVTRVVVVGGPWQHEPVWGPEIPACSLDEFRLLLASQDWRSTDRQELWSFLDELADLGADENGIGYAELFCWSILDAWQAWQLRGMLCPPWVESGTVAHILPRDLDPAWHRDAVLDPFDEVLAGLEMPAARDWFQLVPTPVPAAQPASDAWSFVVTLAVYAPRRIMWVAVDMGPRRGR